MPAPVAARGLLAGQGALGVQGVLAMQEAPVIPDILVALGMLTEPVMLAVLRPALWWRPRSRMSPRCSMMTRGIPRPG